MIKDIKLYVTSDYTPSIGELEDLGKDLKQLMIKHPFLGGYETQLLKHVGINQNEKTNIRTLS